MKEELETTYKNIITLINNSEAEIECMVRQKLTTSSEFAELIIAQKKLQEAEVLIRNILNNIRKYEIMKDDINLQFNIVKRIKYQKKQAELNKKYN